MADICVSVGARIRALRLKKRWRQDDLAAHAEMGRTYLSRVERGQIELCLRAVERIAIALEVHPSELLR